ncbi:MAG: 2-phospho-L-lactate guanylyltransferase [Halobacteriales archaeon]
MEFHVPYSPEEPKTRLSEVLDGRERSELARLMLDDVLEAVEAAGHSAVVLSTLELERDDVDVRVAPEPLTSAVNRLLDGEEPPLGVLVADLPLVTPEAVERLASAESDVALAPGLAGGTNGFVVRETGFEVDFHGASVRDHRERAREAGLSVESVDSFRLAVDLDVPSDVVEVLLHGDGYAARYLAERFELVVDGESRVEAKPK